MSSEEKTTTGVRKPDQPSPDSLSGRTHNALGVHSSSLVPPDVQLSADDHIFLLPPSLSDWVDVHSQVTMYSKTNVGFNSCRFPIGDFRVAFRLCFKASPSAKPFVWKLVLFTCKSTKFACE